MFQMWYSMTQVIFQSTHHIVVVHIMLPADAGCTISNTCDMSIHGKLSSYFTNKRREPEVPEEIVDGGKSESQNAVRYITDGHWDSN